MLYFFKSLTDVYYQILLHFNIDITLFTDYQQLVIVLLCNIISILIFFVGFYILYKFVNKLLTIIERCF